MYVILQNIYYSVQYMTVCTNVHPEKYQNATTTNHLILIGADAGNLLTGTGPAGSIAIGNLALATHTTGERNIAIGWEAMHDTNAGSNSLNSYDNIFIGLDSGGGTWGDSDATRGNIAVGNYTMDAALNAIGRNPGAAGQIQTPMIIGLALIESLVIYALAITFLLQSKI